MNHLKLLSIAMVVTLLSSCGSHSSTEKESAQGIAVSVKEIHLTKVPKLYYYTGTVSSVQQSTLSTRLMGQISDVLVHEGQKVKKGDLLLSIRSNDVLAQQKQVEANIIEVKTGYKHAEEDYKRIQALFENKSATQKELDDITAHYQMMKAKLAAAEEAKLQVAEMLTYANIKAPYDGVITQRFVDAGDMANPGMPLVAIEAPGKLEVNTRIPESDIYKVNVNDTVQVFIEACEEPIVGIIDRVSPSSRFSGSQFDAKISLQPTAKQQKLIHSGVFAHIQYPNGSEDKIVVPKQLIVQRGQLQGVWVTAQDKALLRWVRLGKDYDDKVEVLSGLDKGSQLITQSQDRLFDGALISVR